MNPSDPETTPPDWRPQGDFADIRYETAGGIAKLTINRPEVRNAFRPATISELSRAFELARDDPDVGVVILTGQGREAFCSGGDQKVRGDDGYKDARGVGHLNVLDLQVQIRRLPKPVIAMVAGYAIGGGHVLHLVCDLTVAADNAVFGQTGPKVGSFDAGYGAGLLARTVGLKRAKQVWFLCERYDAATAERWGLVNWVVAVDDLESRTVEVCQRILEMSPDGPPPPQGRVQRRRRRPGGHPGARRERDAPVLHGGGGPGGPRRLPREATSRLLALPAPPVTTVPATGRREFGAALRIWWMGARPRTLGVGTIPVLIGAAASGHAKALPTAAAMAVAAGLQAGANFANDYFDGVRGVDSPARVGPRRLTAGGLMPPRAVLGAAVTCIGIAALVGVWLALASGLGWLLLAGVVALVAAVLYTGGPRPYAATGLVADLAVFAFFGLMATAATAAVQGAGVPERAWWAAVAIGLAAVAVLDANNLRDIATDGAAGRRTLAVRLGERRAGLLYSALLAGSVLVPVAGVAAGRLPLLALGALLAVPTLVAPLRLVRGRAVAATGLAPLLPLTARFHLCVGVLLAAAFLVADLAHLAAGSPPLVIPSQQCPPQQQRVAGVLADAADGIGPPVRAEGEVDPHRMAPRPQPLLPVGAHAVEEFELVLSLGPAVSRGKGRDGPDDPVVVGGEDRVEVGLPRLGAQHDLRHAEVRAGDGGPPLVVVLRARGKAPLTSRMAVRRCTSSRTSASVRRRRA